MFVIMNLMLALVPVITPSSGSALPGYVGTMTGGSHCHMEEKVAFKDTCESYVEETCYTQNQKNCAMEDYTNCTGVIKTSIEKACFSVTEMLCSLQELIHYVEAEETYQVMHCQTTSDRLCDTVYNINFLNIDDYQCLIVETPNCYQEEQTINDITCTDTLEFECHIKQEFDDDYKETVCTRFPKKDCYKVPRKVLVDVCEQDIYEYCEKFTNINPMPVEDQNCHYEKKKICEVENMSRVKNAKSYSYTKDCKMVDREICAQVEKKKIEPICEIQERMMCPYEPVTKCELETKNYCHKVEELKMEEVCDEKFETSYL
eukprot:GFUD01020266.1.p1 GENE.GFUD01020266.1~~GFUD01020266.1.p1  ORF type:complete len:317 (-),score=74.64 GFUD01020266.1:118-1068(-)